jgi:hypothetical protein
MPQQRPPPSHAQSRSQHSHGGESETRSGREGPSRRSARCSLRRSPPGAARFSLCAVGRRVRSWRDYPIVAAAAAFAISSAALAAMAAAVPLQGETVLVVLWCLLCAGGVSVAAWRLGPVFGVSVSASRRLRDRFLLHRALSRVRLSGLGELPRHRHVHRHRHPRRHDSRRGPAPRRDLMASFAPRVPASRARGRGRSSSGQSVAQSVPVQMRSDVTERRMLSVADRNDAPAAIDRRAAGRAQRRRAHLRICARERVPDPSCWEWSVWMGSAG